MLSLRTALRESTTRHSFPFLHYFIEQPLTGEMIAEMCSTQVADGDRIYDGTRAGDGGQRGPSTAVNGSTRCFVTRENIDEFPALAGLVDDLLGRETIELCEDLLHRSMRNCFLRVEVICDRQGFWLEPHQDIREKRMSMLLYANPYDESERLGTDLYDESLQLVKTIPYRENVGYMFAPADNTWHGLEKKEIRRERRSLLINYVTFPTCWRLPGRRLAAA